ncbi:MAG: RNA polymerase sigma factor [Planctomycetota bacterium]
MSSEDQELIQRCAEGDDDAWSELFRRYGAFLDFIVRRALAGARGGVPDANEVAEVRDEVVSWLLQDGGRVLLTYRGESKLTSWLGVVVGRRARRVARRGEGLRHKMVSLDALTAEAASHLAVEEEDQSPRQLALSRLAAAVEGLSDRDRALIRGAFYERRSYVDLAEELGVRPDSIGQLLFRAKSRLKKALGDKDFLSALSGCLLPWLLWLVERTSA